MTMLTPPSSSLSQSILFSPILIVDDTELSLQLIQSILSKQGFTSITCARDGVDALEKMKTYTPSLIILDLMMPRMNGFVLCKYLRSQPEYQHTPILIQTAVSSQEDCDKIFELGATDLIKKPIIPSVLISKISEHLEAFNAISPHKRVNAVR